MSLACPMQAARPVWSVRATGRRPTSCGPVMLEAMVRWGAYGWDSRLIMVVQSPFAGDSTTFQRSKGIGALLVLDRLGLEPPLRPMGQTFWGPRLDPRHRS